ncbi:hypothetical protein VTJ04DRAFT_2760 [Mycothermus thermophilus]|uniref:uncharacterized protein n=1 Tax=Humicola insolens TaxID=85995 RepID=UPI0037430535
MSGISFFIGVYEDRYLTWEGTYLGDLGFGQYARKLMGSIGYMGFTAGFTFYLRDVYGLKCHILSRLT